MHDMHGHKAGVGRADTQPKASPVFLLNLFCGGLVETEPGLG